MASTFFPRAFTDELPGAGLLRDHLPLMELVAFDQSQAAAYLAPGGACGAQVVDVAEMAVAMEQRLPGTGAEAAGQGDAPR